MELLRSEAPALKVDYLNYDEATDENMKKLISEAIRNDYEFPMIRVGRTVMYGFTASEKLKILKIVGNASLQEKFGSPGAENEK